MSIVSVIIPIFNDEGYIEKCLRSVCTQSICNQLEIVIVADGCTDKSVEITQNILNEYKEQILPPIVIVLPQNRGVAYARKVAIEAATGDYIMSCDGDDWMDSRMCELLLSKAEIEGCDVVVCDYNSVIDDKVEAIRPCFMENFLQQLILCRVTGSLCNKLIRTPILKSPAFIYPDHDFSEDHAYCVQVAMFANKIGYVPIALYNYIKRPDSFVRSQEFGRVRKRHEDDLANFAVEQVALANAGLLYAYHAEIVVRKLKIKNAYRQERRLWLQTFPELRKEIFESAYISWRVRVAYYLMLIGAK